MKSFKEPHGKLLKHDRYRHDLFARRFVLRTEVESKWLAMTHCILIYLTSEDSNRS